MASDSLRRLVSDAISDNSVLAKLQEDPAGIAAEYDLSDSEVAALKSNDPTLVSEFGESLGLDERAINRLTKVVCD